MGRVIGCQWQFFITVASGNCRAVSEMTAVTNLLFRFAHFFAYGLTNPSGLTASSEA